MPQINFFLLDIFIPNLNLLLLHVINLCSFMSVVYLCISSLLLFGFFIVIPLVIGWNPLIFLINLMYFLVVSFFSIIFLLTLYCVIGSNGCGS